MDIGGGFVRSYNHYSQIETIGSSCSIYFDFADDGNTYRTMSVLLTDTQPTLNVVYTSTEATIKFIAPGTLADAKSPAANWYVFQVLSGTPSLDDTFVGADGSTVTWNNLEVGLAFRDMAQDDRWFHFHTAGALSTNPGFGYRIGKDADSGDFPSITTEKLVIIVVAKTDSNAANKKSTLFGIGDVADAYNGGKFIGAGPAWAVWGTGGAGAGNTTDDAASVSVSTNYVFGLIKDGTSVSHYRDGALINSGTATGYTDLDADPVVFFNFDNAGAWGNDHTDTTWYGAVMYSVTTVPTDAEMNAAMLWCKDKWVAGEKILYPGFINK